MFLALFLALASSTMKILQLSSRKAGPVLDRQASAVHSCSRKHFIEIFERRLRWLDIVDDDGVANDHFEVPRVAQVHKGIRVRPSARSSLVKFLACAARPDSTAARLASSRASFPWLSLKNMLVFSRWRSSRLACRRS